MSVEIYEKTPRRFGPSLDRGFKPGLHAYCTSPICSPPVKKRRKNSKRPIYSYRSNPVLKENVTKHQIFCPDCESALCWQRFEQ